MVSGKRIRPKGWCLASASDLRIGVWQALRCATQQHCSKKRREGFPVAFERKPELRKATIKSAMRRRVQRPVRGRGGGRRGVRRGHGQPPRRGARRRERGVPPRVRLARRRRRRVQQPARGRGGGQRVNTVVANTLNGTVERHKLQMRSLRILATGLYLPSHHSSMAICIHVHDVIMCT
eukprot:gene23403-biopygen23830